MGLKHEAKKGTVIEVNGVTIRVLRGSPLLEISVERRCPIIVEHLESDDKKAGGCHLTTGN